VGAKSGLGEPQQVHDTIQMAADAVIISPSVLSSDSITDQHDAVAASLDLLCETPACPAIREFRRQVREISAFARLNAVAHHNADGLSAVEQSFRCRSARSHGFCGGGHCAGCYQVVDAAHDEGG